ncbi:MAG: DUF3343 domain-containing protein [Spirochaetaceae bacterium]|jgi:hypothetical protein|nr:DUF3343 domain-containing protein [Spirochaetaceae bacterium]
MTFLLTFPDVYSSLECQKSFKRAGLKCGIENAPAEGGADCGYAVRCEAPGAAEINKYVLENNITYSKITAVK